VGFLLSRRWVLFAVAVVLMTWAAWALGQWQFHRLHERKHDNRVVATNLDAPPVPVTDVLSTGKAAPDSAEWRRVTAHGHWDDEHTIVLKYQTRDGAAGVEVVTPLVTGTGTAVLVDRGWISTENSGASRPKLPPTTDGLVTVTGWVRSDATGSATKVSDLATRAISSQRIADVVPYPLYRGFVDLAAESPTPARVLAPVELPDDTSNGPHFFYGLQWWFFGALAIFGFCYLAWDEVRQRRRRGRTDGPSERPQHAAVHGQHGAADER
jgi:cytochrome oxidase assembly protein ShyY1